MRNNQTYAGNFKCFVNPGTYVCLDETHFNLFPVNAAEDQQPGLSTLAHEV